MTLLVEWLTRLRKEYNTNPMRLLWWILGVIAATTLGGVLMDLFLPYGGWGNIARSIWLAPSSAALFALMYTVGLFLHNSKVRTDPNWVPYRARYSQRTRVQYSIIAGAVMFVTVYATGYRVGFTFMSSLIAALLICCVVFCRSTRQERYDQANGVQDARDIATQVYISEKIREHNEQKRRKKALKASRSRRWPFRGTLGDEYI